MSRQEEFKQKKFLFPLASYQPPTVHCVSTLRMTKPPPLAEIPAQT